MCIPIELDVPVVTLDRHEIGIAREIMCTCPDDLASDTTFASIALAAQPGQDDLWLRVTRSALPDLYIPFSDIAETRSDVVWLRITAGEIAPRHWERVPAAPVPA